MGVRRRILQGESRDAKAHWGKCGMRPCCGKGVIHVRVLNRSSMARLSSSILFAFLHTSVKGSQAV